MRFQRFRFGSLYVSNVPQLISLSPFYGRDIPQFQFGQSLAIKDEHSKDTTITWIKPNGLNLFIADRVLLTTVTWDDLDKAGYVSGKEETINGCRYRCRLLAISGSPNEWDTALDIAGEDDLIWHWSECAFWGKEDMGDRWRPCRGLDTARNSHIEREYNGFPNIGFRPVLELLPDNVHPFIAPRVLDGEKFIITQLRGALGDVFYPQLCPQNRRMFEQIGEGEEIKMYTLLSNGQPVRQDQAQSVQYQVGAKLEFSDEYFGEEFLIPWVVSNGVALPHKPLLQSMPFSELIAQGFA